MGELMEMDVDRVDAVDHPASRRKFLIRKSEGETDVQKISKALISLRPYAAQTSGQPTPKEIWESAIDVLAKAVEPGAEGALSYAKEAIPSLDALAKACGAPVAFTEKGPMWSDENGRKKAGDAHSPMPGEPKMKDAFEGLSEAVKGLTTAATAIAASATAIVKSADSIAASVEKVAVAKAEGEVKPKPKSTQSDKDEVVKAVSPKMGEGLFTSAIFGPAKA